MKFKEFPIEKFTDLVDKFSNFDNFSKFNWNFQKHIKDEESGSLNRSYDYNLSCNEIVATGSNGLMTVSTADRTLDKPK